MRYCGFVSARLHRFHERLLRRSRAMRRRRVRRELSSGRIPGQRRLRKFVRLQVLRVAEPSSTDDARGR